MSLLQDQQSISAGRTVRIQTTTHAAPPTDGVTEPDIVTSPLTATGIPTQGFMMLLTVPTVGAAAVAHTPDGDPAGFHVIPWVRNPVTKQWGAIDGFWTVGREWFSTFDFDGGDLFFQVDTESLSSDGGLDFSVVEQ